MKILIVKIAAIGDVVMALPLLTHIRSQYPQSQITWICGSSVKSLLEATGQIDQILDVDEKALLAGTFWLKILSLLKIWIFLIGRKFDLCITAHPDPRYRWISFPARCKEKRFLNRLTGRVNPIPGRYHAVEYIRLFSGKDGPEEIPIIFPKINAPLPRFLQRLLATLKDKPIIAIAPGGAKNVLADDALRRWPISSYASLMKSLAAENVHLILTGNASDSWVIEHFKGIEATHLIGNLELLDLIALLRECRLLITHDSGPLHLAKIADCPAIGIFGPTNPFEKIGPREKIKILWGGQHLACRPCYDGKTYAPCKRNLCMTSLEPHTVLKEVLKILAAEVHFPC